MATPRSKLNTWYCYGCDARLPNTRADRYCISCLSHLHGSLARELWSNAGMAFGRPLEAVFAKPRRQSYPSWLHHVDEEREGSKKFYGQGQQKGK
jgi:hypothetical protein